MADSTCRVSPQLGENDADGKLVETYDRRYAEIVVIRHGETWWNADGRIQGHLDVELNDVGRKQALAVAERLSKDTKISAVYSSDLKRASETAEIIARCCGGLQVIKDPDLRERHLGDMQGLVIAEAVKLKPKAYQAFTSSRKDEEIPGGGESLDQLFKRCTTALQRIANKHQGERIVVVTHGGVIRTLHRRVKSQGRSPGKILNASVNIFHLSSYDEDKWSIEVWGDVSHLNQNQTSFLESGFGGDQNSVLCTKIVLSIPSILLSSGGLDPVKFEFRLRGFGSSLLSFSKNSRPPLMADSTCSLRKKTPNDKLVKTYDRRYAEIVVIRHGETLWNVDGRIQGHLDVELNYVGRKQALAVAEWLSKERKISAVYSSDLKRASETAEIIARCCGELQVIKDPPEGKAPGRYPRPHDC